MSYAINNLPSCITIGRETETAVTEIRVDCTEWLDRWSNMDVSVIVRTGRGAIYIPANLAMEGKTLVWCVDDVDTSILNKSTMEITGIAPDRHKLSEKVDILVDERLAGTTGETPDPMKPWVDRVIEAANTVGDARDDAVSAKDEAFDSANVAYKAAFDARESEKNAHASEQEAAQSANIAKDAEENTRATLVTVNGLAEYAKSSAEMAKESEEKSLQNANNAGTYATSAKESERIARESGETAKTSAQSAQTSAGSAAESANQAKRSEEAAKGYADNTGEYARIAIEKAQKATEQANSAGVSATSAEESANRASASEQNAATSAQEAKSSADSTKGYSESANEAAVNASDSAREAQVSAENAAASANNAEASKASAQVSAENARVSSQNAEDALQELRDKIASGEFKGEPGEPGKDAVVDATLTQSGQAADAKATGDVVSQLKDDLRDLVHNYNYTLEDGKYRYINSWYGDGYYNWESPGNFIKDNAFWRTEIFNLSDIESFTINKDGVKFLVVYFGEDNDFKTSFSSTQNSGYTYVFDASNNKSKAVIHIAKSTANITDVTINGHYKISVGVKNEDKLKLIYKAKALGGDVDDDVAIQNYINNEKYVYIPKGEYFFNKTVHVKRYGTTIIGEGMGMLTTIRPYDDNCTALFDFNIDVGTSQMYTMKNICLRLLNHDHTTNNGKGIISDKYIIDGVIENCWFNGGLDGDNSSVAIDARLINTRITNCLFECFGTAIKNNDANTSNASVGYIISDCIIWNCVNALDLQGAGIVSGCNIKLRNGFAVKTSSYADVDVSNCRVYDMDIGGINSTLFESNGSSRLFCDGIYVGETSRPLIFDCKDTSELKIYNYHGKAQFKGSGNYITDRNEQMLVYEKITSSDSTALQDLNINNYKEVYYILKNDTAIESNTNIPLIKITTDSETKTAYGVPMNTKNAFISIKWTGLYYIVESISYNDGYGSQNRRENIIDGISGLIKGIEINFNGAKINANTTVKMFKVQ